MSLFRCSRSLYFPLSSSSLPSSSSSTRSSILSEYRLLLRSIRRTSSGYHEILKRQRSDSNAGVAEFDGKFQPDESFEKFVRSQYRLSASVVDSSKIISLRTSAVHLWELFDSNLLHSKYLFDSGWGIRQETKDRVKRTALRVGLEVTEPGQEIRRKSQTKLTGTAGEGYEIGKGAEGKIIQKFDISELKDIK